MTEHPKAADVVTVPRDELESVMSAVERLDSHDYGMFADDIATVNAALAASPVKPREVLSADDYKAIGKALYARREGNRSAEVAVEKLARAGFCLVRTNPEGEG